MILKTIVFIGVFSLVCADQNELLTDETDIERPCQVFDLFCIRKIFVEHSHCKPTFGPAPDPLFRPQLNLWLPRVNLTLTARKVEYGGINGRVVEFYINRKTDKLLLAVEFTDFTFGSNENHFRFHRKGREPVETMAKFFNVSYTSLVSTIIIPNLKDLQLQDSEVFTYTDYAKPTSVVDLEAFLTLDLQPLKTLVAFLLGLPTDIQEGFFTESPFFIGSFIQYNICDFGLNIT